MSGFARPGTGPAVRVLGPRANADRMGDALAALAAHADPDGREVPAGTAGWHVARRLVVPPSAAPHVLPPGTPAVRPVEPLRPRAREAVATRSIGRIDRLRAILRSRLAARARTPRTVPPISRFHGARCPER